MQQWQWAHSSHSYFLHSFCEFGIVWIIDDNLDTTTYSFEIDPGIFVVSRKRLKPLDVRRAVG